MPKKSKFFCKNLLVKATYSPAILRSARLSHYDFAWQLHIPYSWFCESFAKQSCFSRKLSAPNAKSVRSYPPSGVTLNYLMKHINLLLTLCIRTCWRLKHYVFPACAETIDLGSYHGKLCLVQWSNMHNRVHLSFRLVTTLLGPTQDLCINLHQEWDSLLSNLSRAPSRRLELARHLVVCHRQECQDHSTEAPHRSWWERTHNNKPSSIIMHIDSWYGQLSHASTRMPQPTVHGQPYQAI